MSNTYGITIIHAYTETHTHVLALAGKMSDAQLAWQATPTTLPIAFHIWHLGRWADHLQAAIPGMTAQLSQRLVAEGQVWERLGLASQWGFDSARLGYAETGMGMEHELAVKLLFPAKDRLLDYAREAFASAERAINAVDEVQFQAEEQPQPMTEGIWEAGGTVGGAIMEHLTHANRHMGMIECLYGIQLGTRIVW